MSELTPDRLRALADAAPEWIEYEEYPGDKSPTIRIKRDSPSTIAGAFGTIDGLGRALAAFVVHEIAASKGWKIVEHWIGPDPLTQTRAKGWKWSVGTLAPNAFGEISTIARLFDTPDAALIEALENVD